MRARIVAMDSPDADPIEEWTPPDPTNAGAVITLSLGADDGSPGADSFYLVVGTPSHFARVGPQDYALVVDRWEFPTILTEIERRLTLATGETWDDVAAQINEWAHWEFDRYEEPDAST